MKKGRRWLLLILVLAGGLLRMAEVSAVGTGEQDPVEILCSEPNRILGEKAYYRENVEIRILVRQEEDSQWKQDGRWKLCCTDRVTGEKQELTETVDWKAVEEGWEGSWQLDREGEFCVTVELQDEEKETWEWSSPWLVLDKTAPRLWAELSSEPEKILDGKSCFRTETVLRIRVEDDHWRVQELKEVLEEIRIAGERGADVTKESECGKRIRELDGAEQPEGIWEWELPIREDGCFTIPVGLTDLAGNPALWEVPDNRPEEGIFRLMLDRKGPKLCLDGISGPEGSAGLGSYGPDGIWFSDGKLMIKAVAGDGISGLSELTVLAEGENGEKQSFQPLRKSDGEEAWEQELILELPWKDGPERGTVMLEAEDRAGNRTKLRRGFTAENRERHEEAGRIRILTETQPSREADGVAWYNQDLRLRLEVRDGFSGIGSWNWQAGEEKQSRDYRGEAEQEDGKREITWEYTGELTLHAEEYDGRTVTARAEYTDNAGHGESTEVLYQVDVTKPVITVEYEGAEPEPGGYCRESRTAVVTVREQNLDLHDVELRTETEGSDGAEPEIGDWSVSGEGKNREYRCRVTFSADGVYSFTAACQDLAGNRADYDRVDHFIIDRTVPEAEIRWSGAESRNGFYYPGEREAQIRVRERNFAEERMELLVEEEAPTGMEEAQKWRFSEWKHSGDLHIRTVSFTGDGSYRLSVKGRDLAENELEPYQSEQFVIDRTPPELQITGVEDGTANGEAVQAQIFCQDENYDPEGTQVELTGYKRGKVEPAGERTESADGMQWKFPDFPYRKEADDLYSLRVSVRDLAGNTAEKQIRFSVNRFGSVYVLEKETEKLAGKEGSFFTDREPELLIREINVDYLDSRKVICSRNGHPALLEEERDYRVEESGKDESWKEYRYRIFKENFTEEGVYEVTLCSGDRAKNLSDSLSQEKHIEFAVDRTVPEIFISGVENGKSYRASGRDIRVELRDNLQLREAYLFWNGKKKKITAEELQQSQGRLSLRAENRNQWQELQVEAVDGAGNRTVSEKIRILVTPSFMVQFVMNRKLRTASMAAVTAAVAAGFIKIRNRKRKAKSEKNS